MRLSTLPLLMFFFSGVIAQDMQFSHFYSNTLYLNPAFAGAYELPDVSAIYHNQWPALEYSTYTYSFAYNHNLKRQWGGFGVYYLRENIRNGLYTNESIHLAYSPSFKVLKKFILKPALEGAYSSNHIDWDKTELQGHWNSVHPVSQKNYFDCSAGILLYDSVFNAGIAVHHINQPHTGFFAWDEEPIATKLAFHINRNFRIDKRGNFILSPYYIFRMQSDDANHSFNLCFKAYLLTAGAGYQGNDDYSLSLGLGGKRLRLSYTYNITGSELRNATAASHEFLTSFILFYEKLRSDKVYISRIAF